MNLQEFYTILKFLIKMTISSLTEICAVFGDRAMDGEIKEKILFVDDEESILNVARDFFERQGYQTYTAQSGKEALQIIAHQTIDCC
jgi:PleD family two-component response regulator